MSNGRFIFKIASEPWEFEQIHALNYRTFVEEIPQHPANPERRLIDRFHGENTYFICLQRDRLIGMMAMRTNRPFSLDEKVENLDSYLPPGYTVCEMRLLAVEPEYRHTPVFTDLFRFAAEECIHRKLSLAVLSGTTLQLRLYTNLGFVPFARPVGKPGAMYQPMYFTLQSALNLFKRLDPPKPKKAGPVSFLPGPVAIGGKVRRAFSTRPLSHRSREFHQLMNETKTLLLGLTGAAHAELFLGSGTLANDVVAAQLGLLQGPGLVLANGEFGERLVDHATRQGLAFETFSSPWGVPFDYPAIEEKLSGGAIGWLWATHCETSMGTLNSLERLEEICRAHHVKLCMDCTSSVGTVPVRLEGVYLATTVSGKGLASYPGISIVLYNHEAVPDTRLPRYLDLGYYRAKGGVPFTHSHNLLAALREALLIVTAKPKYDRVRRESDWLRKELERFGIGVVSGAADSSPAVLTFALPPSVSSMRLGEEMEERGYLLSYRSEYLVKNNLLQACLMGETTHGQLRRMLDALVRLYSRHAAAERIKGLEPPAGVSKGGSRKAFIPDADPSCLTLCPADDGPHTSRRLS